MTTTETMHDTNSLEGDDPIDTKNTQEKTKSRRPPNSAFRQQRLKAWQPILTPKTVLPLLFGVGVIFAPIGGLLLYASTQVQELVIDYTSCHTQAPNSTLGPMPSDRITSQFSSAATNIDPLWNHTTYEKTYTPGATVETDRCTIQFTLPDELKPPIYLYYRLTKFYQNHRRYVKSLSQSQLKGDRIVTNTSAVTDCDPLLWDNQREKYIYPCGLIANSQFNDTIYPSIELLNPTGAAAATNISFSNTGIAWSSDASLYGQTQYNLGSDGLYEVVPPPNWRLRYPGGNYTRDAPPPNLHTDEAFQVWMRTAGLPTFSKLALRNDNQTMPAGTYLMEIDDIFHVDQYGGTKSIVLSTRTVMGGRNPFLGIAYIVVAGVCIVLGVGFLIVQLIKPRKLGDHTYLSWNNETPSNGLGAGRR